MTEYRNGGQVQTIRAETLEEAKRKLFEKYNGNYVILGKRRIPKTGLLAFFRKEELEFSYEVRKRGGYSEDSNQYGNPMNNLFFEEKKDALENPSNFERNKNEILSKAAPKNLANVAVASAKVDSQLTDMNRKIEEITSLLKEMPVNSTQEHHSLEKIQARLSENDFSFGYIQEICDKMKKTFPLEKLDDFPLVERSVVDWIGESIKVANPVNYRRPRVVIIVGPTGVGKTTTLVKLAAMFIKESKSKGRPAEFCFITTDTMRVGALEQLSRFGEIVGKSVLKAQNKEDVGKLYEQYRDRVDAIFIDTGGYGPNDAIHIAAMKETLSVQGLNPEIYLALSASTKYRDLLNIMQNYEPFGYQGVIVTKCDESNQYGNVISALAEKHKSIAYVTHGQKITETLSRGDVIWFLTHLERFQIDRIHIEDRFYKEDESEE